MQNLFFLIHISAALIPKDRQVKIALLYIIRTYRVSHYYGCDKFKFNNINCIRKTILRVDDLSLYTTKYIS